MPEFLPILSLTHTAQTSFYHLLYSNSTPWESLSFLSPYFWDGNPDSFTAPSTYPQPTSASQSLQTAPLGYWLQWASPWSSDTHQTLRETDRQTCHAMPSNSVATAITKDHRLLKGGGEIAKNQMLAGGWGWHFDTVAGR